MRSRIALLATALLCGFASASPIEITTPRDYRTVVSETARMVGDRSARQLAARHGLDILNVTWEDTGRYKGSAVGPNISDMTIQVQQTDPETGASRVTAMPVIRFPNFADETADVALDAFHVVVGNEKGEALQRITLRELLADLRRHLHDPDSWGGDEQSLLAPRDSHVLVSAQACFLPIPEDGTATFNPVLFNYQSYEDNPAVLTILATREGASVTVIDNKRDGFDAGYTWGQRLFFNQDGERASLTGTRLSELTGPAASSGTPEVGGTEGLNMVLLIQVPLKQKQVQRFAEFSDLSALGYAAAPAAARSSDVENAVIGHGEIEGLFTEIDGLDIRRDPRFPIRVTVQFYKATSNGVVSDRDMEEIASQIRRVYDEADYAGSLVVAGDTGRPTEHDGEKTEPEGWWDDFWRRHEDNMVGELAGWITRPGCRGSR